MPGDLRAQTHFLTKPFDKIKIYYEISLLSSKFESNYMQIMSEDNDERAQIMHSSKVQQKFV